MDNLLIPDDNNTVNFDCFTDMLSICEKYKNFYLLALTGNLNKVYDAEKNFQSKNMTHAEVTLYNSKTQAVIFNKSVYINAKKEPVLKINGKNVLLSEFKMPEDRE